MSRLRSPIWQRQCLALLRLLLLYGLLCGLLLVGGLLWRADCSKMAGCCLKGRPLPACRLPASTLTRRPLVPASARKPCPLCARPVLSGYGSVSIGAPWNHSPASMTGPLPTLGSTISWTRDLVPLVVLDGSPAWARAEQDRAPVDNPLAPPADPDDMARFAAAFATRYGDKVRYYQVWDEPNIAPHWGNHWIEPVAYAQLLKAVAPAIRAADPDAVIATAALAPTTDRGHTASTRFTSCSAWLRRELRTPLTWWRSSRLALVTRRPIRASCPPCSIFSVPC